MVEGFYIQLFTRSAKEPLHTVTVTAETNHEIGLPWDLGDPPAGRSSRGREQMRNEEKRA
jgi:hypothetical protein